MRSRYRHSPDELEYEFRLSSTMYLIKKNLDRLQQARDAIQHAVVSLLHTPAVHYQNLMIFAREHMRLSVAISDNHNAWRVCPYRVLVVLIVISFCSSTR